MTPYRAVLADALEALRIESPTSFTWHGQPVSALPAEVAAAMDAETARNYLVYTIQSHLYGSFYCRGFATVASGETAQPHVRWTPFVHALSEANAGRGSRESGWIVTRQEADGTLVVTRNGLSLWVRRHDVVGDAAPGANVSVTMPKELLRLSPGFYLALGNEEFAGGDTVVRIYWHLRPETAAQLVAALTRPLNDAGIPFRLKVLIDPDSYRRCDAGVLYTFRGDFARVAPVAAAAHRAVRTGLRDTTPVFTKRLAEGLGLAEEPPQSGDSFGMHRCRLVAEALVAAFEDGATSLEGRLAAVAERFEREALLLDTPYLNRDSTDAYELTV